MALYLQSAPWQPCGADTPGHKAMRDGARQRRRSPNDGYTAGWVWSYPLKAALEKAAENKDLTRAGLLAAVKSLTSVDYEGMLPAGRRQLQRQPQRHGGPAERDQQARRGRAVRGQRGRAVLHRPDGEGLQVREALLPVAARCVLRRSHVTG